MTGGRGTGSAVGAKMRVFSIGRCWLTVGAGATLLGRIYRIPYARLRVPPGTDEAMVDLG
jgi:hypothetical protein